MAKIDISREQLMLFRAPTQEERDACKSEFGYNLCLLSRNSLWSVGVMPVLFGARAVAWRKDSVGCSVEYCCGDDTELLFKVLSAIKEILRKLPEDTSERDMVNFMPKVSARPIDRDGCLQELLELAEMR